MTRKRTMDADCISKLKMSPELMQDGHDFELSVAAKNRHRCTWLRWSVSRAQDHSTHLA